MTRRDVFKNITEASATPERRATAGYASKGASRSMLSSIGELAERAAKADHLLEGEVVLELDPKLIDPSFVADRMTGDGEDSEAFEELVAAIRDRGQDSPILVRPHPSVPGRYQSVFGHRRVQAAVLLERPVKAVVREFSDKDHVTAQGQENSAREDLTFVERALFGQQLFERGYDRATIQSALSVDPAMLTRMLSVTGRVPATIIQAIGRAKGVGRDRWLDLAQLIEKPSNLARIEEVVAGPQFSSVKSDSRFDMIVGELQRLAKSGKREALKLEKMKWQTDDKRVSADLTDTGKAFALSLKSKDASRFGRYLAANLDRLYREFKDKMSGEETSNTN